jgi:hypothetical protein
MHLLANILTKLLRELNDEIEKNKHNLGTNSI